MNISNNGDDMLEIIEYENIILWYLSEVRECKIKLGKKLFADSQMGLSFYERKTLCDFFVTYA